MNLSIFEQAGVEVINPGKVNDVFRETGLDWQVEQKQVYIEKPGTNPTQHFGTLCYDPIPSVIANYRSDNNEFLGMVNPKMYKVVQNVEAFDFIDELPNFTYEKVGMFSGGKKVFVVGKSNEQIDIDGSGDLINFYLTFLHGHDGKSGIRFIICPVRMFCMNQLNFMLESASFKFNIKHTGDIQFKLSQIQKAIAKSHKYVQGLEDEIKTLINTKPTISIESFVDNLIPQEENDSELILTRKQIAQETILSLYNNKDDLQNYKGTAFGMISAVSDFISHEDSKRKNACINNKFINNIEGNALLERARILLAA